MNNEQYERLVKSAETLRAKTAEFHRVATDVLTTAQKALDNSVAAFLDGVEQGLGEARAKYERADNVWHTTTDSPRSTPKSPVEEQIADVVNRLRDEYKKTSKGQSDTNPLKTVQDLVNEIFNPKKPGDEPQV